MKELNDLELEIISGGAFSSGFCKGFAAAEIVYGAGVLLNVWNPVGWIGGTAALVVNGVCIFN